MVPPVLSAEPPDTSNARPSRRGTGLVLAAVLAATGLAVAGAQKAAAQTESAGQSAAERCSAFHLFGAEPVDVAKAADGQTVLAQVSWGYHESIGCYLTLDGDAVAALRAAGPPQSLPQGRTDASTRCFEHHRFGAQPVDVAKTADRQTVLARLSWGYHDAIGCYLALDSAAVDTLRAAATPAPTPDGETDPQEEDDGTASEALSPWEQLVYGDDPARLIAFADVVRAYTLGTDTWLVWACDTPAGQWEIPPEQLAEQLKAWGRPYFTWLSDGEYEPEFIAAETVEADDEQDCLNKVRNSPDPPDADGAVIVVDIPQVDCNNPVGCRGGWGEPGRCYTLIDREWIPEPCDPHWPENKREVFLGAMAVTSVPDQKSPTPNGFVFIHEHGHALMLPHSYDRPNRYFGTNLMDFMGNGQTRNFGTPAINRLAAGWIAIDELAIHPAPVGNAASRPAAQYELYPVGAPGTQMLVLPTGTRGVFYTLGARAKSGFDGDIPVEGVEVYLIDQSDWCDEFPWERPFADTCFGIARLQDAYITPERQALQASHTLSNGGDLTGYVGHVYSVGEQIAIEDIRINITGRTPDGAGYTVAVGPAP